MTSTKQGEEARMPPDGMDETSARTSRPMVWILDDSPFEANMARRALAPAYDIETFTDGSTLLERIVAGRGPAALVLDWQLPGMSGIEVCRFLRSMRDETSLPILMLTVYGHKGDLMEGLAAGANDYVTKPYDAPELAARVATLVRIQLAYEAAKRAEAQRAQLLDRERAARSEAEAANNAKDEFLAMVSHELRTPLNAILGWTRMMRGGELTSDQVARALETVERNAIAQTQLIEDIFDMSRIVSGKLTIEKEELEVATVLNSSIDALRPAAAAKAIQIQSHIHPDAGRLAADPSRLQQVIWNLLVNAIKFTPEGGQVVIAAHGNDSYAEISVADSGRGIESGFLDHVFDRFRQGDHGLKRAHGGLGLGLAIVKHIVELHGGSVTAQSDGPHRGATFTVRLPRARDVQLLSSQAQVRRRRAATLVKPAPSALEGLRILIVDDDADSRDLLTAMIERSGARVLAASSAPIAIEMIQAEHPDVVISDIGMPGEDGHEMMRRLRSLAPEEGGLTPALALTAFARAQDRTSALAAGFNMYVSKPVEPGELIVSVATLAGRLETP